MITLTIAPAAGTLRRLPEPLSLRPSPHKP